jgi:pimeloyl-ACP methyl ester carboxylesterase
MTRRARASRRRFGADLLALMDALQIDRAVLAGYDWGGRAACVVAALWPERCAGLVSLQQLQHLRPLEGPGAGHAGERAPALVPVLLPQRTRPGGPGPQPARALAKLLWQTWSPSWQFDDATFARSAAAFDNPDFVDVVIHSYRHRFNLVPGDPAYADIDRRLAAQPAISRAHHHLRRHRRRRAAAVAGVGPRASLHRTALHRIVPGAGHNLPQEAPRTFADAVLELVPALRNEKP